VADSTTYRPVWVQVKETATMGWICRPDHPYPPDPTMIASTRPRGCVAPLRVIVADDAALARDGLVRLLERAVDMEVVGTAAAYDELLAVADACVPDVVVTDIRMPPSGTDEGLRAAAELRRRHPRMGVVVLSQWASPNYALRLLDEGAAGRAYLLKENVSDVDELFAAVRTTAAGGSSIDPEVINLLVSAQLHAVRSPLASLTPPEHEVLAAMATGKDNAAIAATLHLSERTIEQRINSLLAKLGLGEEPDANRRVKAVLLWLQEQGCQHYSAPSGWHGRSSEPGPIRILVVDDQEAFRRAARAVIERTAGFVLAAEATHAEAAFAAVSAASPDLVLMDIGLAGVDGIEATRHLLFRHPGLVVVLLSTYERADLPAAARACGATTYLPKHELSPALLRAVWDRHPDWSS
jgi:DNA-binding NarL/FixJ family response regulator